MDSVKYLHDQKYSDATAVSYMAQGQENCAKWW